MAGEWRELPFSDAVMVNPRVELKRGVEYPFVDMQALNPGARCVYPSEHRIFDGGGSRFAPGDTLMARITPCLENGKTGRFCAPPDSMAHGSTEFIVIRGREGVTDTAYAYYLTRWEGVSGYAISQMTGTSGRQRVPTESLDHLLVPIAPLHEQRAIARILGTLDDKIELNRRMNETLEAIARVIFKSWFVDATLEEFPKGWNESELGEIAEVIDCLHSKKPERRPTGKPLLQLCNIRDDGLIDMTDTYYITEDDYRYWISRMEGSPGDCVITNVGRVAATAQIPEGLRVALGRNMTGMRCRSSFPYPTFLIEGLRSSAMKEEIVLKTDTGTILDALNVRNIPRLRFVKPTNEAAARFEAICRPLRAKMEQNAAESHTLAALRDTLLPKLISGEMRVHEATAFTKTAT